MSNLSADGGSAEHELQVSAVKAGLKMDGYCDSFHGDCLVVSWDGLDMIVG